jgi:hypothetical protein
MEFAAAAKRRKGGQRKVYTGPRRGSQGNGGDLLSISGDRMIPKQML